MLFEKADQPQSGHKLRWGGLKHGFGPPVKNLMSFNTVKTALLLGLLSAVLLVGGGAIGGRSGLYIGLA